MAPTGLSSKLKECLKCLRTLTGTTPVQEEFVSQFKKFLKCFSNCLPDIQETIVHPCNKLHRPKAWLCISQMIKILRLFASYPMSRQTVWYLTEQMQWCVTELNHTLVDDTSETQEPSDSFVNLMDLALHQLNNNKEQTWDTWQKVVHDLVCHAVTIAKVALPTDCKEINSTCQQLLLESDQLTKDTGPDSFQINLLTHSLSTLEQRINTAILQLLLEVFSDPNRPLKQLIGACGSKASQPRDLRDLDEMIAELDAHIERILLVGQYTDSCCESKTYQAKMKCCLASLESVDNYLVPAVTAFYLEPDCSDKRALLKLLCDHWQEEVSFLHSHIDLIVDSQAFAKVTEKSMKEMVEQLLSERSFQDIGRAIVNQGLLLHKHLSRTPDCPLSVKHLKLFKEALFQCQSTLKQQTDSKSAVLKINRIIILAESITEYLDEFYQDNNSSSDVELSGTTNSSSLSGDYRCKHNAFKLKPAWDKSIRKLNFTSVEHNTPTQKSNISRSNETKDLESVKETKGNDPKTPTRQENVVDMLTPYLNRVGERSTTLYSRTPRKFLQSEIMNNSTFDETSKWGSLALDVTEILENLSTLAETLSSEQEVSIVSQPINTTNDPVSSNFSNAVTDSDPVISLDSLDISLPQRLQDLKDLDDKIKMLKST